MDKKSIVELQVEAYMNQAMLNYPLLKGKTEWVLERAANSLVLSMAAKVLGETLDYREYPSDWWSAFKLRWFPKWVLKRFPPNITILETKALYPAISIPESIPNKIVIDTRQMLK